MNTIQYDEKYIEHEVEIRVLKEISDSKFMATGVKFSGIEKELIRIDYKINWVIGIMVTGFLFPILLKIIGVF
jgi:hypothetical protein